MEESLNRLRKPAIQVINVLSLICIFFSYLQYHFDLTLEKTPKYLIVTTIFAIIINFMGLLQLFERKMKNPLKKAKRYLIVDFIGLYTSYLTFYNLYFFVAAEHHYYLNVYWYIGFFTLFICSTMHILSTLLLGPAPKWLKIDKTLLIIFLKIIASLIYVQKIVEYIIVPNIAENHFIFIISIGIIFGCNFLVTQNYILYGRILTEVNQLKTNDTMVKG